MSYAIIRNQKYKRCNLGLSYRHNERINKSYSNKEIDRQLTELNYHLKKPENSYEKEFERIRKENNLKGQIKEVSNITCEYIITSDKEFFDKIGVEETKRYFKTAYNFVCQYKELGENNIISAVVNMDERTPHMHLVFIPVVHTIDKNGQEIDKIACSEFWKAKNSYIYLQNNFYDYMRKNKFDLERGITSEREHLTIKEYKEVTNYKKTKELLNSISLEMPDTPEIRDFKKFMINRDEKINDEIIKPKNELIQKLYKENVFMYKELSQQAKLIQKAEKFEKERNKLVQGNEILKEKCNELNEKITNIEFDLKFDYKNEICQLENKYKKEIKGLKKQIEKFEKAFENIKDTIKYFISWIYKKFGVQSEDEMVHNFTKETGIDLNFERQLNIKQVEKEEENLNYKK